MNTSPIVSRFVEQWSIDIDPLDFVRAHVDSEIERCFLLLADQHLCWKHDRPRPLGFYLDHWPVALRSDELMLRLLIDEFGYREQAGRADSIEAYMNSLGRIDQSIREQLIEVLSAELRESRVDTIGDGGSSARPARTASTRSELNSLSPAVVGQSNRQIVTDDLIAAAAPSLPQFELIEKLGAGAFGVVYRARDKQLDREVAIKFLSSRAGVTDESVDTLIDEARKVAMLDHPGIVPVYQAGRSSAGVAFMVSKYIAGGNLRDQVRHGPLPEREAAKWIRDCADAVAYAHQVGLIHRDIKSANVLLDHHRHVWITDFGLASFEDELSGHTGEVTGTPAYMSPEQVRGEGNLLDGRSDIWSLGVVLYELLTGQLPFRGATFGEVFSQIENRPPDHPRIARPEISEQLESICLQCLQKRIEDRFQTARDLVRALTSHLEGVEDTAAEQGVAAAEKHSGLAFRIAGSPFVYVPDSTRADFTVGRQRMRHPQHTHGCDFVIRCADEQEKSLHISRTHFKIIRDQCRTYIVDMSKLGTYLNGQRLEKGQRMTIQAGDRLAVANVLTLEVLGRDQHVSGQRIESGRIKSGGEASIDYVLEASMGDLTTVEPNGQPG